MPNYQLKHEVPWRRVLARLRNALFYDIDFYQRLQGGRDDPRYDSVMRFLRQSYENYHQLRLFLGFKNITQYERKAREILEKEAKK